VILALARLLPGTPERDLWTMDVDRGLAYLLASSAMEDAATEEFRDAGPSGPPGAAAARMGGLEILDPYLKRREHGV
jgi:hypothetical protein